jgi:hypothetical protein
MQALQDAQLIENLQLFSKHHDNSYSLATEDTILQHKLESSQSNKACKSMDADEEISILISYFENRRPLHAAQSGAEGRLSVDTPAIALAPPLRYSRASKKAAAKTPA